MLSGRQDEHRRVVAERGAGDERRVQPEGREARRAERGREPGALAPQEAAARADQLSAIIAAVPA